MGTMYPTLTLMIRSNFIDNLDILAIEKNTLHMTKIYLIGKDFVTTYIIKDTFFFRMLTFTAEYIMY